LIWRKIVEGGARSTGIFERFLAASGLEARNAQCCHTLSKGALLGARHTRQFRESPGRRNGDDCPAVDGIIEEAGELAGEIEDASTLDAALVATQPCAARPNASGDVHPFNLI
jgi:hypothetical protein